MTASTPNPPDSGAAASRDAARTARRLTDGTLPRTSPARANPPGPTPPPPAAGPEPSAPDPAPPAAAAVPAPPEPPTHVRLVTAGAAPSSVLAEGRPDARPGAGAATLVPSSADPGPGADGAPAGGEPVAPPGDGASAARAPGSPAPARPTGAGGVTAPASGAGVHGGPLSTDPPARQDAGPGAGDRTVPAGATAPDSGRPAGPAAPAALAEGDGVPAPADPLARPGEAEAATGPGAPAPARAAGTPGERAAGTHDATPVPVPGEPAGTGPAGVRPSGPGAPEATAPADRRGPAHAKGTPAGPAGPDVRFTGPAAGEDPTAPADRRGPAHAKGATASPAASGGGPSGATGRPGTTHPAVPHRPAAQGATASPAPAPDGPAPRPGGVQGATASRVGARGVTEGPAGDEAKAPAAADVPVFKPEYELPDLGPITIAGVGTATPRPVRRKNVIGTETTGSIPVHLLFRDTSGPAAGSSVPVDDDGGPDTVAMAPPTGTAGFRGRRPRTATPPGDTEGREKAPAAPPARPAPTADPDLVERPASVLPGWLGIAGGALALAACAAVVWWTGVLPGELERMLRLPHRPYHGIHLGQWGLLALGVVLTLFAFGGLGRGRVGYAWVLTLFGDYRGTVRRTGLVWISPLLLRRRVDVRLRHWRSEPLPAVDAKGTALDVVVLVVWRVRDTVRAALGVDGHEEYLREQVEAAMARVLSQLPADAFHEDAPTLRDAEAVGEALTRMLSAECAPVGLDVFSAQPTRIEYAPEVAAAMRRRRIAAIDAKHRDSVLTSVVDAVDDVVHRLTSRGLVELDDYERKALVKDLTVAFYTGRTGPGEGA